MSTRVKQKIQLCKNTSKSQFELLKFTNSADFFVARKSGSGC